MAPAAARNRLQKTHERLLRGVDRLDASVHTSRMRLARTLCQLATLAVFPALCAAAAKTERVEDPIPERIRKGDVVIAAEEFVRAPETSDSSEGRGTNAAYARIQHLRPMGDGSGRLALNDTRGLVYLTDEHGRTPTTFLDIRDQDVGFDDSMFPNESGLVSVAFHPQFGYEGTAGFGKFYTAYSANSGSGIADYLDDAADSHESVIREWAVTDPSADVFSGSSREVFRIGQFAPNHNIGTIAFNAHAEAGSPDYGMLYVCLGDGSAAHDPRDHGQSLAVPQGAIIRIDPLADDGTKGYGIPPDNPFVGRDGVAPEILAYGLRHPQHFSWDTAGRLFAINADALDATPPVEITELRLVLGGSEQDLVDVAGFPNTYDPGNRVDLRLGIDSTGELYLLTKGDGWVRKLVPAPPR